MAGHAFQHPRTIEEFRLGVVFLGDREFGCDEHVELEPGPSDLQQGLTVLGNGILGTVDRSPLVVEPVDPIAGSEQDQFLEFGGGALAIAQRPHRGLVGRGQHPQPGLGESEETELGLEIAVAGSTALVEHGAEMGERIDTIDGHRGGRHGAGLQQIDEDLGIVLGAVRVGVLAEERGRMVERGLDRVQHRLEVRVALEASHDPLILVPLFGAWQLSSFALRRRAYGSAFVPWMSNDFRLLATNLTVAWKALPGKPLDSELVDPAPGRKARTALLIGLQIALGLAIGVFVTGVLRPAHGNFVTFVTLGLSAWLWVMVLQARSALKLRQVRQNFRTFEELEVYASEGRLGVIGVSPFGLDVVSSKPLKENAKLRLAFGLPQPDGQSVRLEVSTKVHRSARQGSHNVAYLRFSQLDDEQMDRITEYVAVMAGHRLLRDTPDALRRPGRPSAVTKPDSEVAERA